MTKQAKYGVLDVFLPKNNKSIDNKTDTKASGIKESDIIKLGKILKLQSAGNKKFLNSDFISIEQCHARYNKNAKKPPPGPPKREYKDWPIIGMVETKKSIQAMRDYKIYMKGWGDGFESGKISERNKGSIKRA